MNNMRTKIIKIGCALLAVLTLSTTFVACQSGDDPSSTELTATTSVKTETDPVPHYDWGGRTFKILGVHNAYEPNFEVVGEITGDVVGDEVYNRNIWIKDYYNVDIVELGNESDKPLMQIENAISSGDNNYDLTFLVRNDMATAIVNGYMTDLLDLTYLDFTNDWYNPATIESMKIGARLFHMVSDFSLVDKARTNVLYFNRDLAEQYKLPEIIQMVRDGKWTVEEMTKCAVQISDAGDLDGDGDKDLSDRWGMTCGGKEAAVAFWNALDNRVVSLDENGKWSIDVANEHSVNSIEKLRALFKDDMSFNGGRWNDWSSASNTFLAGNSLFMSETLSAIINLGSNAEFSYSVIPFPKYDVEQKQYYTTNDNTYCATFGIPRCAAETDFSAFMVEVLSWKSSTTTYPVYYESVCKVRKSYDQVCSEMLDLVFNGLTFDFGLMYGNYINLKTKVLMESIYTTNAVTTLYEGVKSSTETKLENLFTSVQLFE